MVTRAYALLLVLSVAGFPLTAAFATVTGATAGPASLALRAVILALATGLVLLQVLDRRARPARGWYWWPMTIFWMAYLARLAHDTMWRGETLSLTPGEYWMWAVGACLVPALALIGRSRPVAFVLAYRGVVLALVTAAVIVALLGDTLTTSGDGRVVYSTGRLHLAALNAISVGHLGGSLLLVSVWPIVAQRKRIGIRGVALVTLGAALGLYLVVAAASRGPVLAVLGTLMIVAVVLGVRRGFRFLVVVVVVGGVGLSLARGLEEQGSFAPISRAVTGVRAGDLSVALRVQAMVGATDQFLTHPLLGDALEEESTGFYPHNVLLEAFMATGLVGGVAFLAVVLTTAAAAVRLLRARCSEGWLGLLFLQYVIAAQVSGALYSSTVLWATLASTLAAAQMVKCAHGKEFGHAVLRDRGEP